MVCAAWIELTPFGRSMDAEDEEVDCSEENRSSTNDYDEHEETKRPEPESTRRKKRYRYWTSEDVRDTESFGYTYRELQDLRLNSSDNVPTEKLDSKKMAHSKEAKERWELEKRVWAVYGRGVQGLFEVAGVAGWRRMCFRNEGVPMMEKTGRRVSENMRDSKRRQRRA